MAIFPSMFTNITVQYWKIEMNVLINEEKTSSTSVIFKVNQPPYGGICSTNLQTGTAMLTYFTIYCKGWVDHEGIVSKYEYYGNFDCLVYCD